MTRNVLIVDDSPTVRAVIKKTFKLGGMTGYQVIEAPNGKEALSMLENRKISFMLVDINMPVMNGVELVERMREKELMEEVPVIVISTEGSETRIDELKSKGVDAYIRKPFTPESLRGVITDVVGEH